MESLKMANEKIETWPEAARVINLWLNEFCDDTMPYPAMIAEASRKAGKEIERLRHLTNAIHADGSESAVLEGVDYHMEYIDSETVTLTRRPDPPAQKKADYAVGQAK